MTTPKHPTPQSTLPLSTLPLIAPDMRAQVQQTIDAHPEIDTMDEEARGEIIDITDWRINGGVDRPWGRKARTNNPADPQLNSDGMTYLRPDGLFEIYDCISGIDGNATWDGYGPYVQGENGYWHPPLPLDEPVPGPTPDDLTERVVALEADFAALSTVVAEQATLLTELRAEHDALAQQVGDVIAVQAQPYRAHGPVNLPIVLQSLTSLRCVGDIDVDVKPGTATPPAADADEPPDAATLIVLRRLLNRPDDRPDDEREP